jgi:hypothetical protein
MSKGNRDDGKMNESKTTARLVGALYIIGTLMGILSVVITGPIIGDPDYLVKVFENQNQIVTGAFCILVMGLSLALVPVVLYPLLKKYNRTLALGYVVFRGALETVAVLFTVMAFLLLIILGRENANAAVSDASNFKTNGTLLLEGMDFFGAVSAIIFALGALMLYYVFYKSNLIPRWLSGWGVAAAILYLASGVSIMYSLDLEILQFVMAVQEMVMAAWLIIKGFNTSAIASAPARPEGASVLGMEPADVTG